MIDTTRHPSEVVGSVALATDALDFGFDLIGWRPEVNDEALVSHDGRLRRGVITYRALSLCKVSLTTERNVRDFRRLTLLDPNMPADVKPLVTAVTARIDSVWTRRSGTPWAPLGATETPRVPYTPNSVRAPGSGQLRTGSGVHAGYVVTIHRGHRLHTVVSLLGPGGCAPSEAFLAPLDGDGTGEWVHIDLVHRVEPAAMLDPDPEVLRVWVPGRARPKGSLRAQIIRAAAGKVKVRMVEQSDDGPTWRHRVARYARGAYDGAVPTELPVTLEALFVLRRSDACQETEVISGEVGDLDKLIRNVGDALKDARVIADDRQIVDIDKTRKMWAPEGYPEGAWIIAKEAL